MIQYSLKSSLRFSTLAFLVVCLAASPAPAEVGDETPVLMSPGWAEATCQAWNENATLTTQLAQWIENDAGRGYKILQIYRTDCPDSPPVELRIVQREDEVQCTYGGEIGADEALNLDVDYLMHAITERWVEMGEGAYGPMKAMMFGRLKFKGPMWEAMKSMGPFGSFLQLVGAVESDAKTCPDVAATASDGSTEPEA